MGHKHTATPWRTEFNSIEGTKIKSGEKLIAFVNDHVGNFEDNASFIVHCVNSHDELIEACKSAFNLLHNLPENADIINIKMQLHDAIEKAEAGK